MLKATVHDKPACPVTFPILMRHIHSGDVVLFKAKGIGFVVASQQSWRIGCYSLSWDMDPFKLFVGEIILHNE